MKKHLWKIGVGIIISVVLLGSSFFAGTKCGGDGGQKEEAKKEAVPVSAAEVAQEIISIEEKEKKEKASAEAATPPMAHIPVKVPAPSDKIFYIEGNINLDKANFLKEVTISGIYGDRWSMWMQSTILFHKTAYKAQEVSKRIQLLAYLRPTSERNDNNYITLNFDVYPPNEDEKRWSAAVSFDSRTQGREWFPLAYDIFIQDWQKEEIANLSEQVLSIALTEGSD